MIRTPAYLSGFSSKTDGSFSVRFSTQELDTEQITELSQHRNAFGHLLFKENDFTTTDIPTEQAEDKQKTPSKRLRASLFVLYKQQGEQGDFEVFYREKMEKIISMVQNKLD